MSTTPRLADVGLFIDGNQSQGSGEAFDNIYPATGEALCAVAGASTGDCSPAETATLRPVGTDPVTETFAMAE